MRISIIQKDGTVVKNGLAYTDLDLSALLSDFHALQWKDTKGEIETRNADENFINTTITDISTYQWCIDAWQTAIAAVEA